MNFGIKQTDSDNPQCDKVAGDAYEKIIVLNILVLLINIVKNR